MNIVFVILELGYGGQERQMSYAIKELLKIGYRVKLVVWSFESRTMINAYGIKELGITIKFLEGSNVHKLKNLIAIVSNSKEKIDIVQSWSMAVNFFAHVSCSLVGVKYVGAYRSNFNWDLNSAKTLNKLKIALHCLTPKYIVCNSKISQKQLTSFRRKLGQFGQVYFMANRLNLPTQEVKKHLRGKIHSISVGSLQPYKRWDFLIDVIHDLTKKGVKILHRHVGLNGELKDELINKLNNLGLEKNFIFLGKMDDLSLEYQKSSLLIHTSEVEGTPNAVMEAMSYGLPVFTSNCGDVSYFVSDKNGFVFNDYDVSKWSSKILNNLGQSALELKGAESRKIAMSEFDIQYLATDLTNIYAKILKK